MFVQYFLCLAIDDVSWCAEQESEGYDCNGVSGDSQSVGEIIGKFDLHTKEYGCNSDNKQNHLHDCTLLDRSQVAVKAQQIFNVKYIFHKCDNFKI